MHDSHILSHLIEVPVHRYNSFDDVLCCSENYGNQEKHNTGHQGERYGAGTNDKSHPPTNSDGHLCSGIHSLLKMGNGLAHNLLLLHSTFQNKYNLTSIKPATQGTRPLITDADSDYNFSNVRHQNIDDQD
jgi:hypothetical protein